MPIYRYRCDNCGYEFTLLEPFNSDSVRRCPHCNRETAHRTISSVGIVYKGHGFHNTDYRRNGRARGQRDRDGEGEGGERREGEERREPVSAD